MYISQGIKMIISIVVCTIILTVFLSTFPIISNSVISNQKKAIVSDVTHSRTVTRIIQNVI